MVFPRSRFKVLCKGGAWDVAQLAECLPRIQGPGSISSTTGAKRWEIEAGGPEVQGHSQVL